MTNTTVIPMEVHDCGRRHGKYDPCHPCPSHKAFEQDNCPGCGTATRIG